MTLPIRLFTVLIIAFSCNTLARMAETPTIIGTVENVAIDDINMVIPARIDTGAGMTSLHADIIEIKRGKNGAADKVIFNISDNDGQAMVLEKKIERWIRIKKKGNAGFINRPVVMMNYCLGGQQLSAHTNLANRSRFKYPLLVGRNMLKSGDYLISTDVQVSTEPGCNQSTR